MRCYNAETAIMPLKSRVLWVLKTTEQLKFHFLVPISRMGNLLDMGKAGSLHEYLMLLYERYGPIAGFWWGKKYVVSLASPEYWKEVQPIFDRPRKYLKHYCVQAITSF